METVRGDSWKLARADFTWGGGGEGVGEGVGMGVGGGGGGAEGVGVGVGLAVGLGVGLRGTHTSCTAAFARRSASHLILCTSKQGQGL